MIDSLVKRHSEELCPLVLSSEEFFRLMISDIPVVSVLTVSLFTHCIAHGSCQLSELSESTLSGFLDELSFKVSSTEDTLDAKTSIGALLTVAEKREEYVTLLQQRYEGLATLITRWASRGFDGSIRRLLSLLDPSSSATSDDASQRSTVAATVIQKTWRGHRIRRRMTKLSRVVSRV